MYFLCVADVIVVPVVGGAITARNIYSQNPIEDLLKRRANTLSVGNVLTFFDLNKICNY